MLRMGERIGLSREVGPGRRAIEIFGIEVIQGIGPESL
jgi:hypothetical protein